MVYARAEALCETLSGYADGAMQPVASLPRLISARSIRIRILPCTVWSLMQGVMLSGTIARVNASCHDLQIPFRMRHSHHADTGLIVYDTSCDRTAYGPGDSPQMTHFDSILTGPIQELD
jgi:hypothetical protein